LKAAQEQKEENLAIIKKIENGSQNQATTKHTKNKRISPVLSAPVLC